jgi:hypothetical protein
VADTKKTSEKKNICDRWNIRHFSASQINMMIQNMPCWIVQNLYKVKTVPNLPMVGGTVAERAIEFGLINLDASLEDCIEVARKEFNSRTALMGFSQQAKEGKLDDIIGYGSARKSYPGMIATAIKALRPYGVPSETQAKIETWLPGVPVPIIGYKDFSYDEHGLDVDLKTTGRMPKDMSLSHQLQGAIYWRASNNRSQRFCYTTKSEARVLELDAYYAEQAIDRATAAIYTLMHMLERCEAVDDLTKLVIPNWDDFYWSPTTKAKGMEVWDENYKQALAEFV